MFNSEAITTSAEIIGYMSCVWPSLGIWPTTATRATSRTCTATAARSSLKA